MTNHSRKFLEGLTLLRGNVDDRLAEIIREEFQRYNIGNTSLIPVPNINFDGVEVYAKAEWENGPGNVKARPALWMIVEAELIGRTNIFGNYEFLTHDKKILESSSGNTGIGLVKFGAKRGYDVTLVIPENVSPERKKQIISLGGNYIEAEADGTSEKALLLANQMYARNPDGFFFPNQYDYFANPRSHKFTTAREIWNQTSGEITHFIACTGTNGHLVGTAYGLKELNPAIRVIGVQPNVYDINPFSGTKNSVHSDNPPVIHKYLKSGVVDEVFTVPENESYAIASVMDNDWFSGGYSSTLGWHVCNLTAKKLHEQNQRGVIVTIFPDGKCDYVK